MTWTPGHPDHDCRCAVIAGGATPICANWSQRDGRWFDGYRIIPERFVDAYLELPPYTPEGSDL